ncbi:hypothetical protein GIB67_004675 [Kingdonia uniflora]|uniref:TPX2 C-terminal domain-containing protein n=1 Tax=Kingdonia uniflora TaxID=39325 RepID=A0A7J7P4X9_9MAGN|nr:hypothetical protein GIB67_004675 [Kingdonia uniflora]
MADTLQDEIEIQQPLSLENVLDSSISFGRFDSELLSWDRWSSFSQNKYLEEVGKCSTPGSVAKKKAYFEAHYKKIAAQKSELVEQDSHMEDEHFRSDYPSSDSSNSNSYETDFRFDVFDVDRNVSMNEPPNVEVGDNCQDSIRNGVKEEASSTPYTPKSNDSDLFDLVADDFNSIGSHDQSENLAVLLKEESFSMGSPAKLEEVVDLVEVESNSTKSGPQFKEPQHVVIEAGCAELNDAKDAKLKHRKESHRRTLTSHEKNSASTKNKPSTRTPRSAHTTVTRATKPTSAPPAIFPSRSSTRSGQSLPRNKISLGAEAKKSTNTSLQMSHSLGSTNVESASTTNRRSSIMENMGDKEIVKRAFKAFQKNPSPSSNSIEVKSAVPQKVSENGTKQIVSSSKTLQHEKGGAKKLLEKANLQRGQVGAKSSTSARHIKANGINQTSGKAVPSFGLRSDERAEKRREFLKKLEEKSNAKDVEKTRLRSKSKEEKDAEIKKLRRNLNFKATPMPDFYREKAVSKIHVNKVRYEL